MDKTLDMQVILIFLAGTKYKSPVTYLVTLNDEEEEEESDEPAPGNIAPICPSSHNNSTI